MKKETQEKIELLVKKINGKAPLDGPFDYPCSELMLIIMFGDDPMEAFSRPYEIDS